MNTRSIALFIACLAIFGFVPQSNHPYVSDKPMPDPTLFAEGVVNTSGDEYNPTFSPDGKTVYYAKRENRRGAEAIVFSTFENGKWSALKIAPFSGRGYDKEPYLSLDGQKLFFASTRHATNPKESDFDLYVVERTKEGWGEPVRLGQEVNTEEYENYPAVSTNGNLYFGSVREGGTGKGDLYRCRFVDGKYQKAELLGGEINTRDNEADPYIAPDESYIMFSGAIPGNAGEGDLYISFNNDGKWTKARSLGPKINTDNYEYTPLVSPDGKYLFFSRGWGDIYQIDISAVDLKP